MTSVARRGGQLGQVAVARQQPQQPRLLINVLHQVGGQLGQVQERAVAGQQHQQDAWGVARG